MSRRTLQYLLALVFVGLYLYLVAAYVAHGNLSWWTLPVVLLAMFCADAFSGIVHFIVDYRPNAAGVGLSELYHYKGDKGSPEYVEMRRLAMKKINAFEELVFDFKVHHLTPMSLGRRSFWVMTLPVAVFGGLPLTLLLLVLTELSLIPANLALFALLFLGCIILAQYAHSCTHKKVTPAIPRILQSMHLFLRHSDHEVHHRDPQRNFCMLNGWANTLVNAIFARLLRSGKIHPDGLKVV